MANNSSQDRRRYEVEYRQQIRIAQQHHRELTRRAELARLRREIEGRMQAARGRPGW